MTQYNLSVSKQAVNKSIKQIGLWATVRHMKNLGIPFEDIHCMIVGYPPRFNFGENLK